MKSTVLTVAIVSWMILITSCDTKDKITSGEGFINAIGGKIWYRVIATGNKTPILMLHGGPGHPSYYLNPLSKLSIDRPVIMFDQLGCGRSQRISDTTLMTIENHVGQVNSIVNTLDLKEFYLYGHSWGTMLATDYYLKYPDRIKGLILASPCLNAKMWVRDADTLISTLPDSIELVLRLSIKGVPQDSATRVAAIGRYMGNFNARKQPLSKDLDSANSQMGLNVYRHMWGESEFFATGILKNYDRTKELNQIKVPTLYTVGEFDETLPSTVEYYQSLTPNSSLTIIRNAGHLTMHDSPEEDLKAISDFLNEIER